MAPVSICHQAYPGGGGVSGSAGVDTDAGGDDAGVGVKEPSAGNESIGSSDGVAKRDIDDTKESGGDWSR